MALLVRLATIWATPETERLDPVWYRYVALPASIGYVSAALCDASLFARRTVERLGPSFLGSQDEHRAVAKRIGELRRSVRLAIPGVVVVAQAFLVTHVVGGADELLRGNLERVGSTVLASVTWWLALLVVSQTLVGGRVYYRLGREGLRVDLLDLRPLQPLARLGLRLSLLFVGWFALMVAILTLPGSMRVPAARIPLVMTPILLALGVAVLLTPLLGARARIRAEREAALARIDAALTELGDPTGPGALRDGDRLARTADILALRARVREVPEWLLSAPVVRRFGLYLLIPIGSWVAGALVERGVDVLLR